MTRNDDRDRVGTVGTPHRSRAALDSDRLGLRGVAARLAKWNVAQRRPGFSLERGAQSAGAELEVLALSIEVLAKLDPSLRGRATLRLEHRSVLRSVLDHAAHPAAQADGDDGVILGIERDHQRQRAVSQTIDAPSGHVGQSGPILSELRALDASNLTRSAYGRSIHQVSKRATWGAVSLSLLLGCGGCKPEPEGGNLSTTPATADDAPAQALTPVTAEASDTALPVVAGLGEEARRARVRAQTALLGDALFEDTRGQSVPWISPQATALTPELGEDALDDALLDSLPGSSGLAGSEVPTRHVNGNALGIYQPLTIARADARPLESFYAALRKLEAGEDSDGKVRILMYGASHTDADIYTHYVRAYLRERFGDGGHGFVHLAKPWRWYGHVEMLTEGFKNWKTEHAQRRSGRDDGLYGLIGVSMATTKSKAFGRVSHRAGSVGSNYEIYYLKQPGGGSFTVLVDGAQHAKVNTKAAAVGPGYFSIDLPEGAHTIEVQPKGNGEVRLFGVSVERDTPGVVVDTLGIGGTRASNMLQWAPEVWYDNIRRRNPDLITLAYGTNEANSGISEAAYRERLTGVLTRLKEAAPHAACLLVGPGDFPKKGEDGVYGPRESTSYILRAQREIALEMGCAFWDLRAFMGGEMSMTDWAAATPPMAKEDHIHFTRRGYVRVGMGMVDAMMAGFDDHDVLSAKTP